MIELKEKLKKEILKGGLVVAPQRSGKTNMLMELVAEDPKFLLVTYSGKMAKLLREDFKRRFGRDTRRIVGPPKNAARFNRENKRRKVLLDEYLWKEDHYRGINFFAATTSPTWRIAVIKPTRKRVNKYLGGLKKRMEKDPTIARDFCLF